METCYVRIWGATSGRVFGWLGISDDYAVCIPAGVYSNPSKVDGILPIQWRQANDKGKGIIAVPRDGGDYGLGGKNTGGVDAYWHWLSGAYTLILEHVPGLKLDSPVPGTLSGTLSQIRDGKPFALYCNYRINEDVVWISFHDEPIGPNAIYKAGLDDDVLLEFTTEKLVFEFVPVSAFDAARDNYAPNPKSRYDKWRKIDTDTWMGDLTSVIADRPLSDLVIPGSHDAASWQIRSGTNQRSQTQSRDIHGQLLGGSRYFDLRFYKANDGEWRGNHGVDTTEAILGPVLHDITSFLKDSLMEFVVASLLPWHQDDANEFWDIVINSLHGWAFPANHVTVENGALTVTPIPMAEVTQREILRRAKRIVLFSWGAPPTGTVADGPMKGRQRADFVRAATPESPPLTPGAEPWKNAFAAAQKQNYAIDFDLAGVWLNSGNTTANDIRLFLGAVQPPRGGQLWMMHTNAPATPGGERISTKAARIQPPLARFAREDPVMAAKLNFVNLDFVGDDPDIVAALIAANLFR